MARIRSIKPEFWQDELIASLPMEVRLLYIGLWTMADDGGRFRANPRFVRSQVFPYDPDVDVSAGLEKLHEIGRVQLYEAEGQSFGWVRNFARHQRIDKPKASVLPKPPPLEESPTNPRHIRDASETSPGRKGEEGKGKDQGREQGGAPPPPEQEALGPEPAHLPRTASEPTTPPAEWMGQDFWQWAQWKRNQVAGLAIEKLPHHRKLADWWSSARASFDTEVIQEAFLRFGDDKYWQAKTPPLPFAGFMSQWDRFIPGKAVRNAS